MDTIFDIFMRLPDGKPLWIESVEGLQPARQKLSHLASAARAEYFIYSEKTGGVIEESSPSDRVPEQSFPGSSHQAA
jgi:hypothetical protein